mmetsp:Transcript_30211/g.94418  ORF Transcript_30211/g.94418 Transcript_30211/m.94418 type:complete len:272 (-) Transcript_30211:328-1143(-)
MAGGERRRASRSPSASAVRTVTRLVGSVAAAHGHCRIVHLTWPLTLSAAAADPLPRVCRRALAGCAGVPPRAERHRQRAGGVCRQSRLADALAGGDDDLRRTKGTSLELDGVVAAPRRLPCPKLVVPRARHLERPHGHGAAGKGKGPAEVDKHSTPAAERLDERVEPAPVASSLRRRLTEYFDPATVRRRRRRRKHIWCAVYADVARLKEEADDRAISQGEQPDRRKSLKAGPLCISRTHRPSRGARRALVVLAEAAWQPQSAHFTPPSLS